MEKNPELEGKLLTGSALKWIAILTMFLDHLGAFLIEPYLLQKGIGPAPLFGGSALSSTSPYYLLFQANILLRLIGRLAFPIFAFLIVEGFFHTRNLKRYLFQIGIFALISEIPFNLARFGTIIDFSYQNVFFTLFLGLFCISLFDNIKEENLLRWLVPLLGMFFSMIMKVDYSIMGILIIFNFYYFHDNFRLRNLFNGLVFLLQLTAVFALIPIQLYNGKRGKQNKFFFYVFYPAHLFFLFLVRSFLI